MTTRSRARTAWVLLSIVLAVALGAVVWRKAIKPYVIPKNFGVVVPGQIYRSGELTSAMLKKVVEENGIRTIVDLGAYAEGSADDRREQRTADSLNIVRYRLPLNGDATGNPNYYVQTLKLMTDPTKRPLLVHCNAGSERTSCAVMLYRHLVEEKPFAEVFHEATEHRHDPGRNPRLLLVIADWGEKIGQAFKAGAQVPGVDPVPELRPVPPLSGD